MVERPAVTVVARTVEQHLAAVLADLAPTPPEQVPLADASGLVLAAAVRSDLDLPRFDNSAMDGYAVRLAEVSGAAVDTPVRLRVSDDVPAGSTPHAPLASGTVARVMTGAPVPDGSEAVVPVEWTDEATDTVRIDRSPPPGANIRRRGEDVRAGAQVLAAGTTVTAATVALVAGIGQPNVTVHRRPRVLVLSTGAELVPAGGALDAGQIHDSNGPMLAAALRAVGAEPVIAPIVPDTPGALLAAVAAHQDQVDLVVTSAGVSAGAFDVVKADLADTGVVFARVAMQPGAPQGSGRIGPLGIPVITLPGNPASAYVSFHVFVRPAVRRLLGHPAAAVATRSAVLDTAVRSPDGRRQFLRGRRTDGDGATTVSPVGGPGSHLLGGLGLCDTLIVVPERTTHLPAGAAVTIIPTEGTDR